MITMHLYTTCPPIRLVLILKFNDYFVLGWFKYSMTDHIVHKVRLAKSLTDVGRVVLTRGPQPPR